MDVDAWLGIVRKCKYLSEEHFFQLCEYVKDILATESNVVPVSSPVTICGDIHGQFYDLMELFRIGGDLPDTNYIFMGDYVDRGYYSLETLTLLLLLKAKYPSRIVMLRGNHETRLITKAYGFYEECQVKFGNGNGWRYCMELFDFFTLGALVDGKVLCIHGGLSPDVSTLDQLCLLPRNQELPHEGPLADLVWSDPDPDVETWQVSQRGAGWLFGSTVTSEFLHLNALTLLCRSHQLVDEGYKYYFDKKLVTVWSAPNYCYRCGNKAAILALDSNLNGTMKVFEAVPADQRSVPDSVTVPYFL